MELLRDQARCPKNTDADRATDAHSETKAKA
jgi:hypothetical protein